MSPYLLDGLRVIDTASFIAGPVATTRPLWVEGEAKVPPRYAPELGEHSSAILAEVGYSETDIDRLLADGVVVQDKPAAG